MLIGAYGMFWERDFVEWAPGQGTSAAYLIGRRGTNRPGLQVANFRQARGVYVLFDDHGAYYVGLARGSGGLAERLKQHTADVHKNKWTRFCWFSFDRIGQRSKTTGITGIALQSKPVPASDEIVIRELEALLIQVVGPRGQRSMKFQGGEKWEQIPYWDHKEWFDKVRPA